MHAAELLNERLPEGLAATTEERVAIESDEDRLYRVGPDVSVLTPGSSPPSGPGSGVALEAPYRLVLEIEPAHEHFIRIIEANGERLITVIEVLSPANKAGQGLEDYRRKRMQLISGGVHVVEVDLVRRGDWRRLLRPYAAPAEAVTPYRVLIYTAVPPREALLYPIALRDSLPEIPIPLRPQDRPVRLPLQQLLDQVYARGRYAQRLDYAQDCDPPLSAEDAAWMKQLMSHGDR